jgi:hypothetical protein
MRFDRSTFHDFYGASAGRDGILAERRRWLAEAPEKYLAVTREGEPLVRAVLLHAQREKTVPAAGEIQEPARFLGENWEPDYLLLQRSGTGEAEEARLVAGCVCFPSSWALEEKIGRRISEIHGVVPGLNAGIGRAIQNFLAKMQPGAFWTRSNWGLSGSLERNQHPSRNLPRLDESAAPDEVIFRVEEQSFCVVTTPDGSDVLLFGIRVRCVPLAMLIGTSAAPKLAFALETMPPEMARYKGLERSRAAIIRMLRE